MPHVRTRTSKFFKLMTDRTAIDTIRGYLYQFDFAILSLLKLRNGSDYATIEGIEDVDIETANETTCVQCKYYAKTEYNHSVIGEPIRYMLSHFKDVKKGIQTQINYKLRGYYKSGQSKLVTPLSLQSLKDNFLTYSKTEKVGGVSTKIIHQHHVELNLNDSELMEFIGLLDIDNNAQEFELQFKEIVQLLKVEFSCSEFSSEFFFYNNALRVIRDISKESDIQNRKISKQDFLSRINTSKILFNEWFFEKKGEKLYLSNLKSEFFSGLNLYNKERIFLIDIRDVAYSRDILKDIIILIIKKYTKIVNQPSPFCPYIYIHGLSNVELVEIKKDLIANDIILRDGFDFESSTFNPISIFFKPNIYYQIKVKFVNDLSYLDQIIALAGRRCEIYQFYKRDTFFSANNPSIKEVVIQYKELDNIKKII
jgi:hypothetical protein